MDIASAFRARVEPGALREPQSALRCSQLVSCSFDQSTVKLRKPHPGLGVEMSFYFMFMVLQDYLVVQYLQTFQ
jgi:hypothetical protein